LRGKENLARLYADVYPLYSSEAEVASRSVQHDCAACVDHVCLEEYLIDDTIVAHNVELRRWKMKPPIAEILVYNIDGVIFECGVETGTLEDLSEDSNGVNQVCEGREDGKAR
jgi:hypothetical protein